MKRLAVLLFLAAFTGPGARLSAADVAMPLPTGMAPTSPQVPVPVLVDGLPTAEGSDWARTSFRDRLGIGPARVALPEPKPAGPRVKITQVAAKIVESPAPAIAKPQWCENCAPAVRHPLPPLPAGLSTSHVSTTGSCATGNCATGNCAATTAAPAKVSGSCCQKLKEWMCYHQTPVHFPLVPSPKEPALHTYFPTTERAGICANGGCATGGCATGNCGTTGKLGRGAAGCVPCPTPGESILPGYRLANPEVPPATVSVPAVVGTVETSSMKVPVQTPTVQANWQKAR